MKKQNPPNQADLARLAAMVFPACTAKALPGGLTPPREGDYCASREEESVRVAVRLWLFAGKFSEQIASAFASRDPATPWLVTGDKQQADRERKFVELTDPMKTLFGLDEAHAWIKKNAKAKKDLTLGLKAFEKAWGEFKGPSFNIPVSRLREFLKWLTQQRSVARMTSPSRQEKSKNKKA